MKDPYKTLGVSPDASEDEIKKAYRELAKKYHPDHYANTEVGDIAGEKMKEINEAYDEILRQRASGQYTCGSGHSESDFRRIRQLIGAGRVMEAEIELDGRSDRGAEWNYLKGLCAMQKRNYNAAAGFFATAHNMDPSNREYASMYQRFAGAQRNFGSYGPGGTYRECNTCDICTHLICADCLCECCGGDLIGCC